MSQTLMKARISVTATGLTGSVSHLDHFVWVVWQQKSDEDAGREEGVGR